MRIFCDFHHGALARAMWYLFADRMGHDLYFPSADCSTGAEAAHDGTWGCPGPDCWTRHGLHPERVKHVDFAEWLETQWDACLLTRVESERVLKRYGHPKPGTVYIGVSGNEGTRYDPQWIRHHIATDLLSYQLCPPGIHRIHTVQELGRCFDQGFKPITPEYLHTVRTFINNLRGFNVPVLVRHLAHPHNVVNICQLWFDQVQELPDYTFIPHGHGNEPIGGTCLYDCDLPRAYRDCACTWHFKTYEGYGHSLLQSLPCGRPVLVPRGFYDDRTAGRFLIDGVTAMMCDYSVRSVGDRLVEYTSSLERANDQARRCYDAYKRMFDYAAEAERVREWLERTL